MQPLAAGEKKLDNAMRWIRPNGLNFVRVPTFVKVVIFGLSMFATTAEAARPFVTDDARLTNADHCQLESWSRVYPQSIEFWALPACNLGGHVELTLGGGTFKNHVEATQTHDYVLQVKTLFKPLEVGQFGVGLALGHVAHPDIRPGPNQFGNTYVYVPVSYAYANNVVMHFNLGILKDRGARSLKTTYGLGLELPLQGNWLGISEVYGDDSQSPFYQIGVRYSVVPDRLQIDATTGQQLQGNRDSQWFSLGLRYTP